MVERHARREPDQSGEAEIHRMPEPAISAGRDKATTRQREASGPVAPLGEPRLVAQAREKQAVAEGEPRKVECDEDDRARPAVKFPHDELAPLPPLEYDPQRDASDDAVKDAEELAANHAADRRLHLREAQQAMRDGKEKREAEVAEQHRRQRRGGGKIGSRVGKEEVKPRHRHGKHQLRRRTNDQADGSTPDSD